MDLSPQERRFFTVSPIPSGEVIASVRPQRALMRFRTFHLFALTAVVAIPTSLLVPIVLRHNQTPIERFHADLALTNYPPPRMIATASFFDKKRQNFFAYYSLAYVKDGKFLLRHAYFDFQEPWYKRNWHPLTLDVLRRLGHSHTTALTDLVLDHRPSEEELALFIQPLNAIIDEPKLVLQQLDY